MQLSLPRLHLFEWNDSPWAPAPLRDTIVESLSRTIRWNGMLRDLIGPFQAFLAASEAREVLELCAGAAGPSQVFVEEMLRVGVAPPRFLMTDLFPQVPAWEAARALHPGVLDFVSTPVDATRAPPEIADGRARVIINGFHHFPPDIARAVLADAVDRSAGIFLVEPFERKPLRFLPLVPVGVVALAAAPLLTRRARAAKALFTWATPIVAAAGLWDTVVSSLRVYSEAELRDMVAPLGDRFQWEYGLYRYPMLGEGYYFSGVPKRQR
jgi:hypothetical protein